MKSDLLRPDGFALSLLGLGLVILFVPMMRIPGAVMMMASLGYWLTLIAVRLFHRARD